MDRAIYTTRVQTDEFQFTGGRFRGGISKETTRKLVSVLEDQRIGLAEGTLLSDTDKLTVQARELCPFSRKIDYAFPKIGSSDNEPRNQAVPKITDGEIRELCEDFIAKAKKSHPEFSVEIKAHRTTSERRYQNSHGVEHHGLEHFLIYSIDMERSTENDLFSQWELFDHQVHGEPGREKLFSVLEGIERQLPVRKIPNGLYPAVVLAHNHTSFLTGFWQALDSKEIYENRSPLQSRFEQEFFSPDFHLSIDPQSLGTRGFDIEGVAAKKLDLVSRGRLVDAFYDLEYGRKCGHEASGLATGIPRRRFQRTPLLIPPGSQTLADCLTGLDRAVIVRHCWEVARTTNPMGDFTCGLDALYVEQGKILGRVKNLNMTANIFELFKKDRVTFMSDGQFSPTLGIQAPHILVEGIRFTA